MKEIDWEKVKITVKVIEYVIPKYGKCNWMENNSWSQITLEDIYNKFYKDKAEADEEAELAKEKSENAIVKNYTKLVVTDGMIDYVLEKYGNKWNCEDEIAEVILEDLWIKYTKDDKRKGKVDDKGKGKVDEKGKGKVDENGKEKVDEKGIQSRQRMMLIWLMLLMSKQNQKAFE
ncbi:hypothetical protein Tco_0180863 [Tanacetum coccineum]